MNDIFGANDVSADDPTEWQGLMVDALAHRAMGNTLAAVQAYRQALAAAERHAAGYPDDPGAQFTAASGCDVLSAALEALGDEAGAVKAARTGLRLLERLVARDPSNETYRRQLALAQLRIADAQWEHGDTRAIYQAYEALRETAMRLLAADPGNSEYRAFVWRAEDTIGRARCDEKGGEAAVADFARALSIAENTAPQCPDDEDWQDRLATSHEHLGISFAMMDRFSDALNEHATARRIRQQLASGESHTPQRHQALAENCTTAGDICLAAQNPDEALRLYRKALGAYRQAQTRDPDDALIAIHLCVTQQRIGDALAEQGHRQKALRTFRDALDGLQRLARLLPEDPYTRGKILVCYCRLAEVTEPFDPAEARRWCQQGRDALSRMQQAGTPACPTDGRRLLELAERLGIEPPPPAAPDAQA